MHGRLLFVLVLALFTSCGAEEDLAQFWDLDANPYIKPEEKVQIAPFLAGPGHPALEWFQELFSSQRVTDSQRSFQAAGFVSFKPNSKSRLIGYHPKQPDYVLKACSDQGKVRTKNLVLRMQLAWKMLAVIEKYQLKHIAIPEKWVFILPEEPAPIDCHRRRKGFVLLTDRLPIIDEASTVRLFAQESTWTEEWIQELHIFFQHLGLSDFHFNNMRFTEDLQQLAFFDLEAEARNLRRCQNHFASLLPVRWQRYWKELDANTL